MDPSSVTGAITAPTSVSPLDEHVIGGLYWIGRSLCITDGSSVEHTGHDAEGAVYLRVQPAAQHDVAVNLIDPQDTTPVRAYFRRLPVEDAAAVPQSVRDA